MNTNPKTPLSPVFASVSEVHHVLPLLLPDHHAHRPLRRDA
jgi:hypothetical protein